MWQSLSPELLNLWKCRNAEKELTAFQFDWTFSWQILSTSCVAGHFLAHQSLELGICEGFYTWQRGFWTGDAGGHRGHGEGQRKWTALCHPPVRKPISQPCGHISEQWPSLTAPLPSPPPLEKQDLEKFQVKNEPSNSPVGYSRKKKNKNQYEPGLGSEEQFLLVYNLKGSIRDASSGPFLKLDTMDAIWLTIMNNQLPCTVSLPQPASHLGNHELLQRGMVMARGWLLHALTKDHSEVNRIRRSIESLGWRSCERFNAEAWLSEFSDPLAPV